MSLIESEQSLVRTMNRVAAIVQGDDPAWQDVDFAHDKQDDDDDDNGEVVAACREAVLTVVNQCTLFVEKIQVSVWCSSASAFCCLH